MENLTIALGIGVYFLNEWLLSYKNKLKFYESTLSLIAASFSAVFFIIFWAFLLITLVQRSGFHFIMALALPALLIFQLVQNIKTYIRSKRNERVLVNTINHLVNTKQVEKVSISELLGLTGIKEYHEAERIAAIAKHNGHVPYSLVLSE